jgi:hypothetical protein
MISVNRFRWGKSLGAAPNIPQRKQRRIRKVVPRAGIEPALLSEPDFESGASTNSANGASKVVAGI